MAEPHVVSALKAKRAEMAGEIQFGNVPATGAQSRPTDVTNRATCKSIVNSKRNEYDGACSECEGAMKSDDEWINLVKGILRAEMARRGITYDQLAQRLGELGVQDTAVNIRNKVARGGFSAVFFVQCLKALGCHRIELD